MHACYQQAMIMLWCIILEERLSCTFKMLHTIPSVAQALARQGFLTEAEIVRAANAEV